MKVWVNNEQVSFNVCKSLKKPIYLQTVFIIDLIDDKVVNPLKFDFLSDLLVCILRNIENDEVEEYDKVVASFMGLGSYTKNPCKLDLNLKNQEAFTKKTLIIESLKLELNPLPSHIWYILLCEGNTLPIIVVEDLSPWKVEDIRTIIRNYIQAIK